MVGGELWRTVAVPFKEVVCFGPVVKVNGQLGGCFRPMRGVRRPM